MAIVIPVYHDQSTSKQQHIIRRGNLRKVGRENVPSRCDLFVPRDPFKYFWEQQRRILHELDDDERKRYFEQKSSPSTLKIGLKLKDSSLPEPDTANFKKLTIKTENERHTKSHTVPVRISNVNRNPRTREIEVQHEIKIQNTNNSNSSKAKSSKKSKDSEKSQKKRDKSPKNVSSKDTSPLLESEILPRHRVHDEKDAGSIMSPSQKNVPQTSDIVATPSYPTYGYLKPFLQTMGLQIDYIRGDGNCFFRAMSKHIYGTEDCHYQIRQAIVDIVEKFPSEFEQFLDNGAMTPHISNMRNNGTWASTLEIYAAATILQRDIYVFTPNHDDEEYQWLLFAPRFFDCEQENYHRCHITICHTNGNHYDRIAPLEGACNCHLPTPTLSGITTEIDLTNEVV